MHLQIVVLCVLLSSVKNLDIGNFYNYLRDDSNSSSVKCEEQKAAFLQGLEDGDTWAVKSKKFSLDFCPFYNQSLFKNCPYSVHFTFVQYVASSIESLFRYNAFYNLLQNFM